MIEDLHWIDDPSREMPKHWSRGWSTRRSWWWLAIGDDRALWRARAPMARILLGRLTDEDVRAIIRHRRRPLPAELERRLVARAEGSPFFAEGDDPRPDGGGYLSCEEGVCRLTGRRRRSPSGTIRR
jgi:hypothetical protein